MNFILELPPPIKYNSIAQQLNEFDSHAPNLPLRHSLQSEGVARNRQIKQIGENTLDTPMLSYFISNCKNYAI